MSSTGSTSDMDIAHEVRELHLALLEVVGVFNHPQRDEEMLREAGVSLDRALFPLVSIVGRFGPIGIVDLADRVGRDHTTVSRQIGKLEDLGLIKRRLAATDRRSRQAVITPKGKEMIKLFDAAIQRISRQVFETWSKKDVKEFSRLTRLFADAI